MRRKVFRQWITIWRICRPSLQDDADESAMMTPVKNLIIRTCTPVWSYAYDVYEGARRMSPSKLEQRSKQRAIIHCMETFIQSYCLNMCREMRCVIARFENRSCDHVLELGNLYS